VDGTASASSASVSLNTPEGVCLAQADINGANANALAALAGPRVWDAVGAILSDSERLRRRVLAEQTLARQKLQARDQELQRQTDVAIERTRVRLARLQAERILAHQKQVALSVEVQRQGALVQERLLAEAREQQRQQELQQRAAQAEQQRLLAQQESERRAAAQEAARVVAAQREYAAQNPPMAPPTVQPAWQQAPAATAPAYAPAPGYAPVYAPAQPSYAAQGTSAGALGNPGFVPHNFGGQRPGAMAAASTPAAPSAPAPIAVVGGKVSPATQAWLAQQGLRAQTVSTAK